MDEFESFRGFQTQTMSKYLHCSRSGHDEIVWLLYERSFVVGSGWLTAAKYLPQVNEYLHYKTWNVNPSPQTTTILSANPNIEQGLSKKNLYGSISQV